MDGSTRVTILAALEFSYPQQRITAAASVDALVSGKHFSLVGPDQIFKYAGISFRHLRQFQNSEIY